MIFILFCPPVLAKNDNASFYIKEPNWDKVETFSDCKMEVEEKNKIIQNSYKPDVFVNIGNYFFTEKYLKETNTEEQSVNLKLKKIDYHKYCKDYELTDDELLDKYFYTISHLSITTKKQLIYVECLKRIGPKTKWEEPTDTIKNICTCTSDLFIFKGDNMDYLRTKFGKGRPWLGALEQCLPVEKTIKVELIRY